jgi:OOP family OmpA-OmpF porin
MSLEGRFTYSDIDGYYRNPPGPYFRASEPQLDLGAHVLAYYDREAVFAPYAQLGFGYQKANLNFGGKESNPTASIGAGFKWRLGQSQVAIRGEVSLRRTFDGGDRTFDDSTATLGVQYSFGRGTGRASYNAEDVNKDSDGDGVLDMWDECPNTPPGVTVSSRGCEIQDMNRDSDNDRVPDSIDQCPNTVPGAAVDPQGCSLDSDMDGVLTGDDRCPGTPAGATVDEFGCVPRDDDNDGVPNNADNCPDTRAGAKIDIYGCEIRDIISLPGVNFQTGSDLLAPGAEQLVELAAQTLNNHPEIYVEVAGHTDSQGSDVNNIGLSDRRAKTVLDYLVSFGVDPARLTYKGYGESQPIADNSTAEGRALNRRVELRVAKR